MWHGCIKSHKWANRCPNEAPPSLNILNKKCIRDVYAIASVHRPCGQPSSRLFTATSPLTPLHLPSEMLLENKCANKHENERLRIFFCKLYYIPISLSVVFVNAWRWCTFWNQRQRQFIIWTSRTLLTIHLNHYYCYLFIYFWSTPKMTYSLEWRQQMWVFFVLSSFNIEGRQITVDE